MVLWDGILNWMCILGFYGKSSWVRVEFHKEVLIKYNEEAVLFASQFESE